MYRAWVWIEVRSGGFLGFGCVDKDGVALSGFPCGLVERSEAGERNKNPHSMNYIAKMTRPVKVRFCVVQNLRVQSVFHAANRAACRACAVCCFQWKRHHHNLRKRLTKNGHALAQMLAD